VGEIVKLPSLLGFAISSIIVILSKSLASATPPSTIPPQSGTLINSANAPIYERFLPPGADLAVKYGLVMRVVPSKRLDWSAGFTAETEKYSGQVGLDSDDYITNYVAGMPFPRVSVNDPKAAVKIAYNWHMGPFMPDDFVLEPWGSFAYSSTDATNSFVLDDQNSYVCNHFSFLRYAHRTEVDPRPTLGANEDGVEWKARCDEWSSNRSGPGSQGTDIWVRYLDPRRTDLDANIRGHGRAVWGIPTKGCRACHQPYWAYGLPKTEEYSYRLLGTSLVLACLTTEHEPAGLVQRDNSLHFAEEPFQLRNAYILEMTPKSDNELRTIVYVDSESYLWLGAEFFDGNGQTEEAFPFWRSHRSPSGGYLFDLAGEFYVPLDGLGWHLAPLMHSTPKLFFRSLVPAHGGFDQEINTGKVPEAIFDARTTR
jgi:hypothetical protein